MVAGTGDDTLVAGDSGNGNSATTFVYAAADGDLDAEAHVPYYNGSINNTLQLADLDAADVTLSRVGGDLQVAVNATGKVITVGGEFHSTTGDGVQQIAFADGTVLTRDQIQAQAWYRAGAGDVTVTAQDGGGTMAAGTGDDTLVAGDSGNGNSATTFVYAAADGDLDAEAHVPYYNGSINNTLQLADLDAADVTLSRVGGDLQVAVNATGKVITVGGEFHSTTGDGVQQIAFADGTVLTRDQIQAQAWYRAGAGDVTVTAQDGGGTMAAGTGDDTLVAGDSGNGNSATTFVYAAADGDLDAEAHVPYYNGSINNTLQLADLDAADVTLSRVGGDLQVAVNATGKVITVGGEFHSTTGDGVQQIAFADGTVLTRDQIQAQAWYRAGAGDVTVTAQDGGGTMAAGTGDDTLVAGDSGNGNSATTFVYAAADGDLDAEAHVPYYNGSINNTLQLADLDAADVTLSRVGGDLQVAVNATGKVITVGGEFHSTTGDGVQQIAFADGTVLTRDQIQAQAWYRAGAGDVTVTAQDGGGTMAAGTGDDTLVAGDSGNGNSATTFVYAAADGDLDAEAHVPYYNGSINNTLQLADLDAADVTLSRVGGDLQVAVNATGKVITVGGEFHSTTGDGVQQIAFADGTVLTRDQIQAQAWYRAGAGDVTVTAQDGGGTMAAGTGDDTLVAGDSGNGNSATTFVYAAADGDLDAEAHVPYYNGPINNTLQLADLDAADVTLSRVGGDLQVAVNATGKVITVGGEFHSTTGDGVQQIAFADGTVLTRDQIQAQAWYRAGAGDVTVTAQDGGGTMAAGTGDDTLVAGDSGNGNSATTFVYAAADGDLDAEAHVPYYNGPINNTLQLADLDAADVTLSRVGGDLQVAVNATGKVITVGGEFHSTTGDGVQQIAFADGTVLTRDQIQAQAWYRAGAGDVTVTAQDGGGTMAAGTGDDTLVAGDSGNGNSATTFVYAAADGDLDAEAHVPYYNGSINNTLQLADLDAADVTLSRVGGDLQVAVNATGKVIAVGGEFHSTTGDGVQQIAFADGTVLTRDQIQAQAWYRAGAGDVTVTAQDGGGTMAAGTGDDTLVAGDSGNGNSATTFVYAAADGDLDAEAYVPYYNGPINNTLQLADLDAKDVTISRVGSDLQVSVNATGKVITVGGEFNSTTGNGVQQIAFADGTALTRNQIQAQAIWELGSIENDTTYVSASGLTVDFGTGDHTVTHYEGETGQIYHYSSQGGNDTINTYTPTGTSDVLKLTDLDASDVTLTRNNADLLIGINATGKTIVVQSQWYDASGERGVSAIDFADGSSLDQADIQAAAWYRAGAGDQSLSALSDGATFQAGPGSDTFTDSYDQGTFVYASQKGNLGIQAHSSAAHTDTLSLTDLNPSDLAFSQNGSDLLIGVNATSRSITVFGEFNSVGQDGVQSIAFANGTTWNHAQIVAEAHPAAATAS